MNVVEVDARKLRLSGMATVLETRLRQAQTEPGACSRPAVARGRGSTSTGQSATRRRSARPQIARDDP